MKRIVILAVLTSLALISCDYDVPITAEPTRKVDPTLLGDWVGEWNNNLCRDQIKVRTYDDSSYIVSYNGDLYRAWHSDVEGAPLLTVKQLDPAGKYSYLTWKLSDGGKQLVVRAVNGELVPKETRDSAAVVKLLQANAGNEALFVDPGRFTKQ